MVIITDPKTKFKGRKREEFFHQSENQQVIENAMNSNNPFVAHQRNKKRVLGLDDHPYSKKIRLLSHRFEYQPIT